MKNGYSKMLPMLLISLVIMYSVMFLNVDDISHIYLSLTRLYMSLLMVSPMAVLMLLMMKGMYPDKKRNRFIILTSIAVFAFSLTALRMQLFISDTQYMRAMIPHHSSAILTSKHAQIADSQVKRLSIGIIESQEREIAEMKDMLAR